MQMQMQQQNTPKSKAKQKKQPQRNLKSEFTALQFGENNGCKRGGQGRVALPFSLSAPGTR